MRSRCGRSRFREAGIRDERDGHVEVVPSQYLDLATVLPGYNTAECHAHNVLLCGKAVAQDAPCPKPWESRRCDRTHWNPSCRVITATSGEPPITRKFGLNRK